MQHVAKREQLGPAEMCTEAIPTTARIIRCAAADSAPRRVAHIPASSDAALTRQSAETLGSLGELRHHIGNRRFGYAADLHSAIIREHALNCLGYPPLFNGAGSVEVRQLPGIRISGIADAGKAPGQGRRRDSPE
jgi:hypothetical protein